MPGVVVRPSSRRRRRRILVAVDTGPWLSKGTSALTAKLIKTALWIAKKHDAELHVLHAWIPYGERMIIRAGMTDVESQQFLAGLREEVREELDLALAPFRAHIDPARVHLVKGDPRDVIADVAADHNIDLLVVGTVGRSGVAGRIVGNTAEAVMTRLPCSMLVIKPDHGRARRRR
jgi:nucleotide-binding universal stress UspA family protein